MLTTFLETPDANPNEKQILWRAIQLMRLNCLVFVFDGPGRPNKRGYDGFYQSDNTLPMELLKHLGIPFINVPGEAEAECAALEKLGIVVATWSDDGDAVMFGAKTLIRFFWKAKGGSIKGNKDLEKVRVYRSKDIESKYTKLDSKGLVLWAVLAGGDYNKAGLRNCGPEKAIRALEYKDGLLAKLLWDARTNVQFDNWRNALRAYFVSANININVPNTLPNLNHVIGYRRPNVS